MKFELKNPFAKKPPVSDNELDNTKKVLRESQREFEHQSRKYEAEMTKLRELVAQASQVEKDSAEYKSLQQQAVGCKQRADGYEKGMKAAYAVLEKNRKFESMLENGMTLSRLNGMLPDPDAAEKLLQKISDIAQEFNEKQEELSDLFKDYSEEIDALLPGTFGSAFADFDAMVDAQRAKNEEKAAAEAAAVSDGASSAAADEQAPETPEAPREEQPPALAE